VARQASRFKHSVRTEPPCVLSVTVASGLPCGIQPAGRRAYTPLTRFQPRIAEGGMGESGCGRRGAMPTDYQTKFRSDSLLVPKELQDALG
jgi:hypothetical protein